MTWYSLQEYNLLFYSCLLIFLLFFRLISYREVSLTVSLDLRSYTLRVPSTKKLSGKFTPWTFQLHYVFRSVLFSLMLSWILTTIFGYLFPHSLWLRILFNTPRRKIDNLYDVSACKVHVVLGKLVRESRRRSREQLILLWRQDMQTLETQWFRQVCQVCSCLINLHFSISSLLKSHPPSSVAYFPRTNRTSPTK